MVPAHQGPMILPAMPTAPNAPTLPLLYSFRRCPYAMRARLGLKVAGVAVRVREVSLRDKPAALLAASPKGTVPVLQLPSGQVVDESLDIMRWALAQHDPEDWLCASASEAEHVAMQAWIACNDGAFKRALDAYKYATGGPTSAEALRHREAAVAQLLAPMEQALTQHPGLLRPTPSLADMALLPFVRQFAAVDSAWWAQAPLPQLRDWLLRLTATPLFAAIGTKLTVWQPGKPEPLL